MNKFKKNLISILAYIDSKFLNFFILRTWWNLIYYKNKLMESRNDSNNEKRHQKENSAKS